MERSLRVDCVVLRHSDWGEADRLLWLFTRERGKLRVIAKGVRKPRSRKAGHLEPFMRATLQLSYGRELWIVTQADTLDAYLPLRDDLLRAAYAAYIVELLDRFTYDEGENRALYALLIETLERAAREDDPFLAVRYYELRLLEQTGFRPNLFHCVECAAEIIAESQFFSAERGGVLCPRCGVNVPATRPVSLDALRFLRHLQRSPYTVAKRAMLSAPIRSEMEALMQFFITFMLERGLNSPEFLKRVRRNFQS
jgi:DNA repair protein RecO (recombination protein O)